jgi:TolB-like protein/DNA-binding winged helix-turn-helix (wHTH) protein/Flp pilus assembly protein TadD
MAETEKSLGSIRFGPFELSLETQELRKHGRPLKLSGQAIQVLELLTTNVGKLVTRDELQQKLWPGGNYGDPKHGLNAAVNKLRETLGDSAITPTYVETLPGRGYRFIAKVDGVACKEVTPPDLVSPHKLSPYSNVLRWLVVSVAGLLLVLLGVTYWRRQSGSRPKICSIAVLPLQNLSGDPSQEYFADGMTEELTTEFAQISALNVISHTSVVQYKGTTKPLPQIARELGVDAVVEGAVKRSGDKVGITVQLIDGSSDRHLWANSYERDLRDVLDLQREVTHAIVNEIQAKLTVLERARLTGLQAVDTQAHEDYLRGRFSLEKREVNKSIAYFQQAIQKDPNYAQPYAGLANAYILMAQPWITGGDMRPLDVLPKAEAAARKALQIDASLADGHLALARVIQLYDWDWSAVEKEYRRALELNPNDALGHAFFAEYLQEMGRNEEALVEYRRAAALNPLVSGMAADVGMTFYTARQYDAAIQEFRKVLDLDPNYVDTYLGLGWVYQQKKMYPEAIAELQKAVSLSNRHEVPLASLGQVLGESGKRQEALKILEELKRRSQQRYISPCLPALVQIGLGERDQAIALLEQCYNNRDQWILFLKVDPHMDDLRTDPRFQELLKKVGY